MTASLTPQQTMLLWTLLAEGGEPWQRDIKPPVDAKVRTALQQARLVEIRKQKNAGNKPALLISVTDSGWAFANEHLAAPLPDKVRGAAPVLQKWLTRLHGFMRQRGLTLADLFTPVPAASGPTHRGPPPASRHRPPWPTASARPISAPAAAHSASACILTLCAAC